MNLKSHSCLFLKVGSPGKGTFRWPRDLNIDWVSKGASTRTFCLVSMSPVLIYVGLIALAYRAVDIIIPIRAGRTCMFVLSSVLQHVSMVCVITGQNVIAGLRRSE